MNKKEIKRNFPSKSELYNKFIKQIDIVDIRLISAKVENVNLTSSITSENKVRMKTYYKNNKGKIDVYHHYYLTVKDTEAKKTVAKLSVLFNVVYSSQIDMNGEIFNIFNAYNIPLNTWPYFREFTQGMFARMGCLGEIAPTFKTSSNPSNIR
jgi:hypothetical protein